MRSAAIHPQFVEDSHDKVVARICHRCAVVEQRLAAAQPIEEFVCAQPVLGEGSEVQKTPVRRQEAKEAFRPGSHASPADLAQVSVFSQAPIKSPTAEKTPATAATGPSPQDPV